ncbi:MAG: DUF523 domain-containing protein, partial [Lentisphaeria bacterium]|nr:DUF523 domain-containing protein [Lentisphaeria bacterium]
MNASRKIRLGISACLLGEKVRYDGRDKLDRRLVEALEPQVEFVPICPEMECGLGVPREPILLVGDPEQPRLLTLESNRDLTRQMEAWIQTRIRELAAENLCGLILKSKSPSCGMARVEVRGEDGSFSRNGTGLFARAFMERFPQLPVEEEARLHNDRLREDFLERVFRCAHRNTLSASPRGRGTGSSEPRPPKNRTCADSANPEGPMSTAAVPCERRNQRERLQPHPRFAKVRGEDARHGACRREPQIGPTKCDPLRNTENAMRKLSVVAPEWWDYTTLDTELVDDVARLTVEDLAQLSRPGFKVVMYDTIEDFYLAEALEYIEAWKQSTPDNPCGICGPIGPTEQLPLVARIVNSIGL